MAFEYLEGDDKQAAVDLAKRIAAESWVLFAGAGLSKGAGLPDGPKLIELIEQELGLPAGSLPRNDLPGACSLLQYSDGKTRGTVIEFLQWHLDTSGRDPTPIHEILVRLSPPEILTTNPEDLWEKALRRCKVQFHKIVRDIDWGKLHADPASHTRAILLIMLHGDLEAPDTLVFTTEDLARTRYPKEELIRANLETALSRRCFLFIGYRGNDPDIIGELLWVNDRIGGQGRHFLVTDSVESFRRRQLAQGGVLVIALSDYSRLEQFLQDLTVTVEQERRLSVASPGVGFDPRIPPLLDRNLVADLFKARYEKIREAISAWRLSEAERGLRELLGEVEEHALRRPELAPVLTDFRQRILLALANVLFWRSRRSEALDTWGKARSIGPFGVERRPQAATVAANLSDADALDEILAQGLEKDEEQTKLRAISAALRRKGADVIPLIPEETTDIDLQLLRIEPLVEGLTESGVRGILESLDAAWKTADGCPPAKLRAANLTLAVCQRMVREGWLVPEVNRRRLLRTIRARYGESLEHFEPLSNDFPEGLHRALTAAIMFHAFLDEREKVDEYTRRLKK